MAEAEAFLDRLTHRDIRKGFSREKKRKDSPNFIQTEYTNRLIFLRFSKFHRILICRFRMDILTSRITLTII